jgi:hypothetical protein
MMEPVGVMEPHADDGSCFHLSFEKSLLGRFHPRRK